MLFIGASTAGSRSFELFPRWSALLGIDATLEGHDVPLGAAPEAFRAAVEQIADGPGGRGRARDRAQGRHLPARPSALRRARPERPAVSGGLVHLEAGHCSRRPRQRPDHRRPDVERAPASDPWTDGGQALCLGAGGAGTAIAVCLVGGERPPESLVVTDTDAGRLEMLRAVLDELGPRGDVRLEHAEENDALLERLPPGSLVVNATGLGKDAPARRSRTRPSSPSAASSGSSTTAASSASSSRRGASRMLAAWSSTTGGGTSSTAGSRSSPRYSTSKSRRSSTSVSPKPLVRRRSGPQRRGRCRRCRRPQRSRGDASCGGHTRLPIARSQTRRRPRARRPGSAAPSPTCRPPRVLASTPSQFTPTIAVIMNAPPMERMTMIEPMSANGVRESEGPLTVLPAPPRRRTRCGRLSGGP